MVGSRNQQEQHPALRLTGNRDSGLGFLCGAAMQSSAGKGEGFKGINIF